MTCLSHSNRNSTFLHTQGTIEYLVPVFLTLLKDSYPDVRLNVIGKLSQVNQVCVCLLSLSAADDIYKIT